MNRQQRKKFDEIDFHRVRESLLKEIERTKKQKPSTFFGWLRAFIYKGESDQHIKAQKKLNLFDQRYPFVKTQMENKYIGLGN